MKKDFGGVDRIPSNRALRETARQEGWRNGDMHGGFGGFVDGRIPNTCRVTSFRAKSTMEVRSDRIG